MQAVRRLPLRRALAAAPRRQLFWDDAQRRWATSTAAAIPPAVAEYVDLVGREAMRLQKVMADGVSLDSDRQLRKRFTAIERSFERALEYNTLQGELADLKAMMQDGDEEMAELARADAEEIEAKMKKIETEFDEGLILDEDEETMDVLLEAQGGAGGAEADLFASELFDAYRELARDNGWGFEMISGDDEEEEDMQYIAEDNRERVFSARVTGDGAFRYLKWESGVHKVQRVPETETGGRIHTSTVGVRVLPAFSETKLQEYNRDEFQFTAGRSSGPGGQGVNSINTQAIVKHRETGLVVTCQETRVLQQNTKIAFEKICAMLWEQQKQKDLEERGSKRASLAFSLDRHNKIRTYNWDRQTVTDHRLPKTSGVVMLDEVFQSCDGLNRIIESLILQDTVNRKETWYADRVEQMQQLKDL